MNARKPVVIGLIVGMVAVLSLVFVMQNSQAQVSTGSQYSAVLLVDGQAYFGKLEKLGSAYPVLTDVYYVQRAVNAETKETSNTLVKRGGEWHGPDRMILNADHILFVEPVTEGSAVAKLIEESSQKK